MGRVGEEQSLGIRAEPLWVALDSRKNEGHSLCKKIEMISERNSEYSPEFELISRFFREQLWAQKMFQSRFLKVFELLAKRIQDAPKRPQK